MTWLIGHVYSRIYIDKQFLIFAWSYLIYALSISTHNVVAYQWIQYDETCFTSGYSMIDETHVTTKRMRVSHGLSINECENKWCLSDMVHAIIIASYKTLDYQTFFKNYNIPSLNMILLIFRQLSTHFSLIMPYGDINRCQNWLRWGIDAWWRQATAWASVYFVMKEVLWLSLESNLTRKVADLNA